MTSAWGVHESVLVWADSNTIEVRGTPLPVFCGSIGDGGAMLTAPGLLLLRRRVRNV
jgi:hypothetical protein